MLSEGEKKESDTKSRCWRQSPQKQSGPEGRLSHWPILNRCLNTGICINKKIQLHIVSRAAAQGRYRLNRFMSPQHEHTSRRTQTHPGLKQETGASPCWPLWCYITEKGTWQACVNVPWCVHTKAPFHDWQQQVCTAGMKSVWETSYRHTEVGMFTRDEKTPDRTRQGTVWV